MADIVTTRTIINGKRNLVVKTVDLSDGTGIVNYPMISAAAFNITPHASLWEIMVDVRNGRLQVIWDGVTPDLALVFGGQGSGNFDYSDYGGLYNSAIQPTGNIFLTFDNAGPGSSFTVQIELKKNQ